MPANALTPLQIQRAKPRESPYKLRDGKGLYLEIRPSGKRVWRYRYRIAGAENIYTVGECGDRADQYTLAAAREERDLARKLVKQGIHPGQHRKHSVTATIEENKNTFRASAEDWLRESRPHWSAKYVSQVRAGLDNDILPAIGDKPIRAVDAADVLAILKAKKSKPTWAILLRQFMGAIFRYAIAHQRASNDPTYAVRGAIKRPAVKHHAPLQVSEIPALLRALETDTGSRVTRIATELLLLTFVRPGELAKAQWSEFDLDGALWKIPAEKMKKREIHFVPLSSQAVALLRELHKLTGEREYLFPNRSKPKAPITTTTFNRVLERLGYAGRFTPHGFRATFSTWANEVGFRSDLIEKQLAHAERNQTRAAYNQAQFLTERRAMMQQWADVIAATADAAKAEADRSNVVPINAAKAA